MHPDPTPVHTCPHFVQGLGTSCALSAPDGSVVAATSSQVSGMERGERGEGGEESGGGDRWKVGGEGDEMRGARFFTVFRSLHAPPLLPPLPLPPSSSPSGQGGGPHPSHGRAV